MANLDRKRAYDIPSGNNVVAPYTKASFSKQAEAEKDEAVYQKLIQEGLSKGYQPTVGDIAYTLNQQGVDNHFTDLYSEEINKRAEAAKRAREQQSYFADAGFTGDKLPMSVDKLPTQNKNTRPYKEVNIADTAEPSKPVKSAETQAERIRKAQLTSTTVKSNADTVKTAVNELSKQRAETQKQLSQAKTSAEKAELTQKLNTLTQEMQKAQSTYVQTGSYTETVAKAATGYAVNTSSREASVQSRKSALTEAQNQTVRINALTAKLKQLEADMAKGVSADAGEYAKTYNEYILSVGAKHNAESAAYVSETAIQNYDYTYAQAKAQAQKYSDDVGNAYLARIADAQKKARQEGGALAYEQGQRTQAQIDLANLQEEYDIWCRAKRAYDSETVFQSISAEEQAVWMDYLAQLDKEITNSNWKSDNLYLSIQSIDNLVSLGTVEQELKATYGDGYDTMLAAAQTVFNAQKRAEQQKTLSELMGKSGEGRYQSKARSAANTAFLSTASVISNALASPLALFEIVAQPVENKGKFSGTYDVNASGFGLQNFTEDVRGIASEGMGKVGSMLYSTVLSGIDSAAAMYIGNNLLGNGKVGVALLGINAGTSTASDIVQRGGSYEDAIIGGIVAGTFESLFETVSIGNFYKLKEEAIVTNLKTALKNIGKSALVNFSEEAVTETANILYDTLAFGDISNWQIKINKLVSPEIDERTARNKVIEEFVVQIMEAGLSGAIMGVGFGAVGAFSAYKNVNANKYATYYDASMLLDADVMLDINSKFTLTENSTEAEIDAYGKLVYDALRQKSQDIKDGKAEIDRKIEKEIKYAVKTISSAVLANEAETQAKADANAESASTDSVTAENGVKNSDVANSTADIKTSEIVSQTVEKETYGLSEQRRAEIEQYAGEVIRDAENSSGDVNIQRNLIENTLAEIAKQNTSESRYAADRLSEYLNGGSENGRTGVLSEGQVWNDGTSTAVETERMAESTEGRTDSGTGNAVQSISRENVYAYLRKSGAGAVSTASLGVSNGTSQANLYEIKRGDEAYTALDLGKIDTELSKAVGITNVRYVAGRLQAKGSDGQIHSAGAAVLADGTIILSVTDKLFEPRKLARHELFHAMFRGQSDVVKRIADRIQKKFTAEQLTDILAEYSRVYAPIYGNNEAKIIEEFLADAYAGMNRFGLTDAELKTAWAETRQGVAEEKSKSMANNDSQFSASEDEDAEYLELAKDPVKNEAKLREMVRKAANDTFKNSKVRDKLGNLIIMFHGTSNYGFTVFDAYGKGKFGLFGIGNYFTDNREIAETYQEKGKGQNKGIYAVYLNITNPMDMDKTADIIEWKKAFEDADFDISYLDGCNTNTDCFKALKEYCADAGMYKYEAEEIIMDVIRSMGYDGITHVGGLRRGHGDITHRVFIALDPEQIKSADTVTYDDNGNVIPLSERFSGDVDIRLSADSEDEKPVSEEERRQQTQIYDYITDNGLSEGAVKEAQAIARGEITFADATNEQVDELSFGQLVSMFMTAKSMGFETILKEHGLADKLKGDLPDATAFTSRVVNTFKKMFGEKVFNAELSGIDFSYMRKSEKQSLLEAMEMLKTADINELEKRLYDEDRAWGSTELDAAMVLEGMYMHEAEATGNHSKLDEWSALIRRKATQGGQLIEAFKKWINSPRKLLLKASEMIETLKKQGNISEETINAITKNTMRMVEALEALDEITDETELRNKLVDIIVENANIRKNKIKNWYIGFMRSDIGIDIDYLRSIAERQIESIPLDYVKRTNLQKLSTLHTMNMLFNFKTGKKNVKSNFVSDLLGSIANDAGYIVDRLMSIATKTSTVGFEKSWFSKDKRQGASFGLKKGLLEAALDVDTESSKYSTGNRRTWSAAEADNRKNTVSRLYAKSMSGMEHALRIELNATDEFIKESIRREVMASLKKQIDSGIITKERAEYFAEREALVRSFQDPNALSRFLAGIKKSLNEFAITDNNGNVRFGMGDFIQKFTQVPGSIVFRSIEFSPVGYLKAAYHLGQMIIKKANYSVYENGKKVRLEGEERQIALQREFALAAGRAITGSGLIKMFALLAKLGIIKNKDDEDNDDIAALTDAEGLKSTMFNISALERVIKTGKFSEWKKGDIIHDISYQEPANVTMAIGTELASEDKSDVLGASVNQIWNSISQLSMMQGISSIVDSIRYYNEDDNPFGIAMTVAITIASNSVTSFVPSLIRQFAQATDNTYRDQYTRKTEIGQLYDKVLNAIPFARKTLPEKLTPFGEAKTYGDKWLNAVNALVSAGGIYVYQRGEVSEELNRLREAFKDDPDVNGESIYPARNAPKAISGYDADGNKISVELTAEQREQYQRDRGTLISVMMLNLMDSTEYKNASDEQRVYMLSKVKSIANDVAERGMLESLDMIDEDGTHEDYYYLIGNNVNPSVILDMQYNNKLISVRKANGEFKDANGDTINNAQAMATLDVISRYKIPDAQKAALVTAYASETKGADITDILNNTTLTFNDCTLIWKKFVELGNNKELSGADRANELAYFVDSLGIPSDARDIVLDKDHFTFSTGFKVQADSYYKYNNLLDNPDKSKYIVDTVNSLVPEDGKQSVTQKQIINAVREGLSDDDYIKATVAALGKTDSSMKDIALSSALSDKDKANAIYAISGTADDNDYAINAVKAVEDGKAQVEIYALVGSSKDYDKNVRKFTAALDGGVNVSDYLNIKADCLSNYDDGNGSIKQAELIECLNHHPEYTDEQKAVLFQLFGAKWKKNPYSKTAMRKFLDAYNIEEEETEE